MPKISVLCVTHRPNLINYGMEALAKQSFPLEDIELIVVDDLYGQRELPEMPYKVLHIPPQDPKPYCIYSHAANTGLKQAQGELVFFMNDAMYPDVGVLERHWYIYKKYGPKLLISGPIVKALELGLLDNSEISDERSLNICFFVKVEENLFVIPPNLSKLWWAGRNDSACLEVIKYVGGFEELLDGHIGWHDCDLSQRLTMLGCPYFLDQAAVCWEFPHEVTHKEKDRTVWHHDMVGESLKILHYFTGEVRSFRSLLR